MDNTAPTLEERIVRLEKSLLRTRLGVCAAGLALAALLGIRCARPGTAVQDEVRARRIALVDDQDRVRVLLAQDPRDTQRRDRSAGLTLFDTTGHERGGFSTFEDGSVVLGMDAPHGVGDPMPDRLGMIVGADGSSHVMLLDNLTRAVAKLQSDGDGGGGVQVFKWDMEGKQIHTRTLTFDGDRRETAPLGPPS